MAYQEPDGMGYTGEPPPGWGKGAVHPEANAIANFLKEKGWLIDERRKGNTMEMFEKAKNMPKAKLLYLHGYGENKTTAQMQLTDMKHVMASAHIDVHIIEGFEKIQTHEDTFPIYPADPEYAKTVLSGDLGAAYFWWKLTVPVCPSKGDPGDMWRHYDKESEEIQVAAVKQLAEHIERLGGVDGIVGFSMGGEMAYLLLHHIHLLSPASRKKLKFVGTVGSEHILSKIPLSRPFKLPHKMGMWFGYGTKDAEGVHDVPLAQKFFEEHGAYTKLYKLDNLGHQMPKIKHDYFYLNQVPSIPTSLQRSHARFVPFYLRPPLPLRVRASHCGVCVCVHDCVCVWCVTGLSQGAQAAVRL